MGILTFDWNQIAYIGSPLMVPWWAEVHIMAGFVGMYWLVVPILYYSNVSCVDFGVPSFYFSVSVRSSIFLFRG